MWLKLLNGLLLFWWSHRICQQYTFIGVSNLLLTWYAILSVLGMWIEFNLLCILYIYRRCLLPYKSCLWKGYCSGVPKLVISSCGLECDIALTQKYYATIAIGMLKVSDWERMLQVLHIQNKRNSLLFSLDWNILLRQGFDAQINFQNCHSYLSRIALVSYINCCAMAQGAFMYEVHLSFLSW